MLISMHGLRLPDDLMTLLERIKDWFWQPSAADLALRSLSPRLRRLCVREPDAAMAEITRLRAWVKNLEGRRRRKAYRQWLKWFWRKAETAKRENERRLAVEAARKSLPDLPRSVLSEQADEDLSNNPA